MIKMQKPYIKDKWITKEGTEMFIRDMTTGHIQRTIDYLRRTKDFYDVFIPGNDAEEIDYEDNEELVERKITELEAELRRRQDLLERVIDD